MEHTKNRLELSKHIHDISQVRVSAVDYEKEDIKRIGQLSYGMWDISSLSKFEVWQLYVENILHLVMGRDETGILNMRILSRVFHRIRLMNDKTC